RSTTAGRSRPSAAGRSTRISRRAALGLADLLRTRAWPAAQRNAPGFLGNAIEAAPLGDEDEVLRIPGDSFDRRGVVPHLAVEPPGGRPGLIALVDARDR